jgi:polynucleotide 5'-hydroxyl-kinase GRC3/NOL9
MVVGSSDSGKSTFVQWLLGRLSRHHGRIGWIDGDIGQSTLGVPTTMNLAVIDEPPVQLPRPQFTFFVGSNSPRDHMLPTLVGLKRLHDKAVSQGTNVVVIDTTGFVREESGGGYLKHWKIELLQPSNIIALQKERELDHIISPLKRCSPHKLHILPVAKAVRTRPLERRASRRRSVFYHYFRSVTKQTIRYSTLPVYGSKHSNKFSLTAFQDGEGFCLGLGVVLTFAEDIMEILTPLSDLSKVESLRIGSLRVDPATGIEIY